MIVMMVRDVMTREPVTVDPRARCHEARRMMDQHRIRHLPVTDQGRLVGIVSDRDVRSAMSGKPGANAGEIMTLDPLTVTSETRIEHAARIMLDARVGSLPVVDGTLVGIVTYTDLLRAFVQVLETATQERIAVEADGP